jgi:hypothetical protein
MGGNKKGGAFRKHLLEVGLRKLLLLLFVLECFVLQSFIFEGLVF